MIEKILNFIFLNPIRFIWNLFINFIVITLNNYLPHLCLLVSLFSALILILLDPVMSYYAYPNPTTGGGDVAKSSMKFVNDKSYSTALDILWTFTFIYLVKTDGQFIDKFIELLKLLKSNVSKVQSSVSNKLNKLAGKK